MADYVWTDLAWDGEGNDLTQPFGVQLEASGMQNTEQTGIRQRTNIVHFVLAMLANKSNSLGM